MSSRIFSITYPSFMFICEDRKSLITPGKYFLYSKSLRTIKHRYVNLFIDSYIGKEST